MIPNAQKGLKETLAQLTAVTSEARQLKAILNALTTAAAQEAKRMLAKDPEGVLELRTLCDIAALSTVVRQGILASIFIEYPRITALLTEIGQCHMDGIGTRTLDQEPECMFVEGGTHAGKTAVRKFYERAFYRDVTADKTIIPILPVILPYPAKPKDVAMAMLKKLGDPHAERGTTAQLGSRVAGYLRDCGVQLIVLDEMHHMIDRTTDRVLMDASEWLKRLIKDTLIPVVALGKPTTKAVLDYDEQLKRLFNRREVLAPFAWDYADGPASADFRCFLHAIDMQLPLAERSHLGGEEVALRIHYATDGVVGFVMTLVRWGARYAMNEGREKVGLADLARAFEGRVKTVKTKKQNPFVPPSFTPALAAQWKSEEKPVVEAAKSRAVRRASEVLRA